MDEHKITIEIIWTHKITSYDLQVIRYKNTANIRIFYIILASWQLNMAKTCRERMQNMIDGNYNC